MFPEARGRGRLGGGRVTAGRLGCRWAPGGPGKRGRMLHPIPGVAPWPLPPAPRVSRPGRSPQTGTPRTHYPQPARPPRGATTPTPRVTLRRPGRAKPDAPRSHRRGWGLRAAAPDPALGPRSAGRGGAGWGGRRGPRGGGCPVARGGQGPSPQGYAHGSPSRVLRPSSDPRATRSPRSPSRPRVLKGPAPPAAAGRGDEEEGERRQPRGPNAQRGPGGQAGGEGPVWGRRARRAGRAAGTGPSTRPGDCELMASRHPAPRQPVLLGLGPGNPRTKSESFERHSWPSPPPFLS